MIDPGLLARVRSVAIDDDVVAMTDPVIVLTSHDDPSGLRGGSFADVDLARAEELAEKSRRRADWRPHLTNRSISEQFSAPAGGPRRGAAPAGPQTAVRMPVPSDGAKAVEVLLFWAAAQLLSEWQVPDRAAKDAAIREVRAACGAAHFARAKNVGEALIEESLDDIASMVDSLIWRRGAMSSGSQTAPSRHRDAVRAVSMLATGLPSAARLRIEGLL